MSRSLYLSISLLSCAFLAGCESGLEPVPFQGISGTVTYVGQPPDSTEWVRLVVYRRIPVSTLDFLQFAAFGDSLDLTVSRVRYHLALDTGRYEWAPAVWKRRDAPLGPSGLRIAGWYSAGDSIGEPVTFRVEPERETTGIDVTVDFGRLLTADEALTRLP